MFDWCRLSAEIWSVWVWTKTKTSFRQEHGILTLPTRKKILLSLLVPLQRFLQSSLTPIFLHSKKMWPWPCCCTHCSLIIEIHPDCLVSFYHSFHIKGGDLPQAKGCCWVLYSANNPLIGNLAVCCWSGLGQDSWLDVRDRKNVRQPVRGEFSQNTVGETK